MTNSAPPRSNEPTLLAATGVGSSLVRSDKRFYVDFLVIQGPYLGKDMMLKKLKK